MRALHKIKAGNHNIIERGTDHRGRQEFTIRRMDGTIKYSCRRRRSLLRFLEQDQGPVVEYNTLPNDVKSALAEDRAANVKRERLAEHGRPVHATLASIWPMSAHHTIEEGVAA